MVSFLHSFAALSPSWTTQNPFSVSVILAGQEKRDGGDMDSEKYSGEACVNTETKKDHIVIRLMILYGPNGFLFAEPPTLTGDHPFRELGFYSYNIISAGFGSLFFRL